MKITIKIGGISKEQCYKSIYLIPNFTIGTPIFSCIALLSTIIQPFSWLFKACCNFLSRPVARDTVSKFLIKRIPVGVYRATFWVTANKGVVHSHSFYLKMSLLGMQCYQTTCFDSVCLYSSY